MRNCCELYFDRIVQFKDRLKALLNSCKKLYPNLDWKISAYLKAFEKAFGSIIRARNHTHHHGRYDDDDISQLALMSLLQKAPSKELAGLTGAHFENVVYRRAAQKWRKHVTDGADVLSTFCESVAQMLLAQCDFLGKYRRSKDSGSSSPGTDDH